MGNHLKYEYFEMRFPYVQRDVSPITTDKKGFDIDNK